MPKIRRRVGSQNQNIMPTSHAQSLNELLRSLLDINQTDKDEKNLYDEYWEWKDTISDLFTPCPCTNCPQVLTKRLILQRLAIIDSIYATNVFSMRRFGLQDIADKLWNLCEDSTGVHTDAELIRKAQAFMRNPSAVPPKSGLMKLAHFGIYATIEDIVNLFKRKYGYTKRGGIYVQSVAVSLISKYLHFLLESDKTDNYGFPIYDQLALDMYQRIAPYLGITPMKGLKNNIQKYVTALFSIVDELEKADPILWSGKYGQKFQLLDILLWRMGKIKKDNIFGLLTREEFYDLYVAKSTTILPSRIQILKDFMDRNRI